MIDGTENTERDLLQALREKLREKGYPKAAKAANMANVIDKAAREEIHAVAEDLAKVALSGKSKTDLQEKTTDYVLEITSALAIVETKII